MDLRHDSLTANGFVFSLSYDFCQVKKKRSSHIFHHHRFGQWTSLRRFEKSVPCRRTVHMLYTFQFDHIISENIPHQICMFSSRQGALAKNLTHSYGSQHGNASVPLMMLPWNQRFMPTPCTE